MVVTWSCGTCNARFRNRDELTAHRIEAHPAIQAGYVAYQQVMDNGGTEAEADEAADKAEREYREAVRA